MNYLNQKLQRAMQGRDASAMQEVASQAARFGSRDIMRQAERGLRDLQKAQERAQRELVRAQREQERQARQQARDAERAARQQAGDYKGDAIAFFTEGTGASRRVIPITAPSGGVMKKWGKSGVLWDGNTGLPYAMDPNTRAMTPIDIDKDGKTVVKDGHVYKVVEGLPWKWAGFDPEKVGNNPQLAKELAAKTADAKREADQASDKAAATRKLIADNEKTIRALEKQQRQSNSEEHKRLQGEIDQLNGKNKGLRERLQLEQIDAHKKAAYRQQVENENDRRLADDLAARQKLAYQGDPKGGLGLQSALNRVSQAQQGSSVYNNDPVAALMGAITDRSIATAKNLAPDSLKIADSITNAWNANQKARTDAKIDAWGRNKSIEQTNALLAKMDATGTYKLTGTNAKGQPAGLLHDPDASPALKAKIQDFVNKTGITEIPRSWMTPEAQEARANAQQFGLYDVKLPKNFVLSKGAISTTRDEQASLWGIPMPWNTKGKPVDVGTYQFDRNGVPFIELNKDNRLSPSQLSGSPLDGVKEYLPMPADWAEQFKPRKPSDFSLSMLPADKRREVMDNYKNELANYQQTAKDAWAGQKMDAERFNDTLTRWTVATPQQRQEMIAELDPSQANIPASERRLNTRALFENGIISAQEGRLLERAFYGTDPVMPNVNEAFDDWMKNSKSKAAEKLREDLQAAATMERPKAPGIFGKLQGFAERFAGPIGGAILDAQTASERSRAKWDLIDSAKREFLTEYRNENSLRVDYNPAAFVELRGKLMDDKPMGAWANQTAVNFLAQAAGPMVGMASGTVQLGIDSAFSKLTGNKLLTDQERDLITQQTAQAAANMDRAIQERGGFWGINDLAKNLTNPVSFQNIVGSYVLGPRKYFENLWDTANEGKTGMQINRIFNDIQNDIDYERMDRQKLDAYQAKLTPLLNEFAAMGEKAYDRTGALARNVAGYLTGSDASLSMRRAPHENSLTDPNSAIAQALVGFRQTGDLAYMDMARSAAFNSGAELALSKAISDHASMGGRISATTFGSPYLTAYRSGMVAPITEGALELGTNIAAVLTGGSLKFLQVAGSAARAGSAMSKAGRAVASLDDVATAYNKAGLITRNPGTALTFGQTAWNTGLQAGKQILASSGGEFFQEYVAAFGQAGATLGDAFNQGVQGAIFGVGMSAVHYPVGAAISQVQQMRRDAAQTKALTQFVADYNKHNNTGTQLTLDIARQAQAYQSPDLVRTLAAQRQNLLTQRADINQALRSLPAEPEVRPGAVSYAPNPRRVELLNQQAEINAALAANALDTAAVSEMSINTAREINALPPGQREVVDAALRAANGVPLSVSQESALLNHQTASGKPAAYTYGDDIVLTDEFREEIKQVAPETAKAPVLRKTQAERDAELRAKYGGVFRMVNGRPVFIADKKPASATTPVQPSAPTPTTPSASTQTPVAGTTPSAPAPSAPSAPTVLVQPATPTPAAPQNPVGETPAPAPVTPSTPTNTAGPQVPAPIPVTPPVTQNFQTPDGAQVTGTFEKQPDGSWQQTSPEAPIFAVTPENTQFIQTLEDKAAYALNPQTPDAVQPGEFGQEGYTATTPAGSADTTAGATPQPLPETETADVFTQPINRGTALLMLQTAAPWVSGAPIIVRSQRFFQTEDGRVVDASTYATLSKSERAEFSPVGGAMFVHQGKVHIDETGLVEYLANTTPEARQEKLKAALREELIHVATLEVRDRKQLSKDWSSLPDEAKRRVIETYYTEELRQAGGDWTKVKVPGWQAAAEFWRMYMNAVTEGRTTEQVDIASEVASLAETNPSFAQRIKEALQDIARWLREELLGQLDPDTRAEFEQTAAKIDAEVAKLDAMLGITPQAATPAAEAASPMEAPVEQANAPPVSAASPAETIDTSAAPLTRLPEKAAPRNQAFVPKPARGAQKWTQEALNTALTSATGSFGYKIVDTGIPSQYTAYGETLNYGTALYDKLNPGNEIGKWIDAMNADTNPAGNAIIQAASEPGLHRVWYGHDFFTNVDNVAAEFGWSEVPSYIIQLFKDSLTRSGLPLPGVELLVQSGTVSDRVATDWLSTNIGEVFGAGLSFLGTYKLYRAAKSGRLSKPQVIFATVGIGLKVVSGVMTAQPFLILSGLADTAILVTNLDQVKAAFKKGIQEFNKKPQAVRDLFERVAPPTAVAPVSQESSTPQDGREVKLPGSYPGDAGSTPAPATTLPVQPVQSVEATPPPLPPEDVVTPEQEVVTDEATPPPLPPEPTEPAAAPTIKMAQAAKTLGVTPKELLRLVKAAMIPAEKRGNNYLFTQEALDAYAAERAAKQAPVLDKLAAVAGNTATEEDVADLRERGLVDIYRGERVINQKGYDLMAQAGMAPRLTRNQRVQEIDDLLGPEQVDDGSDIPLNPRVTRQGRLYIVRGPMGSTPAQIPITNERQARERANAMAEQFDAREIELEALRQEQESQQPEPEPEAMDLEPSETDAPLIPKFYNLLVGAVRDYNSLRERGEALPESGERLVSQALAIAQRLGMENLHPGTLLLRLGRLPVGPLMRSQATLIDAVHDVLQDGTRDIPPADLNLKSGIASPAGFTNRDSSPLSWGQLIQLGALRATPQPDGSLRVSMGKTPEQMKADAERAELEAMQQEYLDELRSDIEEVGGLKGAGVGLELLRAIEVAGGIPTPTGKNASNFRGELKTLQEAAQAAGRGVTSGSGIFLPKIFRKNAPDLDRVAETLRGHGFNTFTPSDVIELLDERFTRNRPMYGTATDFNDGMGERAVAAKPRVRLANAIVTTEAGPIFLKKAHHGTPHKVDRFSLQRIGTGEGAQAYGWGLYFAQSQDVARIYKDQLSGFQEPVIYTSDGKRINGAMMDSIDLEVSKYLEVGERNAGQFKHNTVYYAKKAAEGKPEVLARLEQYGDRAKKVYEVNRGNIYTVELDVDDADLLDWDAPLSAQSEKVQAALAEMNSDYSPESDEYDANETGQMVYTRLGNAKPASEKLLAAGIPGIRYLDQGSRGGAFKIVGGQSPFTGNPAAGFTFLTRAEAERALPEVQKTFPGAEIQEDGTYNFVIFDENLIRIVAENGEPVGNAGILMAKPTAAQRKAAKEFTEKNGSKPAEKAADAVAEMLAQVASPFRQTPYQVDLFNRPEPANAPREIEVDEYDELERQAFANNDLAALSKVVAKRGRASAILPEFVDGRIPVWNPVGTRIESPADFAALMLPIRSPYQEMIKVAVLDDDMNIVSAQIISVGTVNAAMSSPAMLFGNLSRFRQSTGADFNRIIISHNHPGGDPSPSPADDRVQRTIDSVAKKLGYEVVDHVITNGKSFYSYKEGSVTEITPTLAPWEKASVSSAPMADSPRRIWSIAKELRQGNKDAAHVLYQSTRLRVLAVEQVPWKTLTDPEKLVQKVFDGASQVGASFVSVAIPTPERGTPASGLTGTRVAYGLAEKLDLSDIKVLDVIEAGEDGFYSYAETGILRAKPARGMLAEQGPAAFAPHQLDLFSDNYNQTAKPWTPSWQAKEPAKAEGETAAPALSLEQQTEGAGRIEDFGEKLEGARKDLWQRYTDMVMAELPADARDITLAKYLPEPDHEAMIASGMEPARVAAVKALRDLIPRKPSTGYKLAIWTKMVRDLRPLIQRLIDPANPIPLDKFQLAIADSREIRDAVRFYEDLGWPHFTQAKGWKLKQSQGYVRWNGEPVAKGTIVTYMSQDYRTFPALASLDPDGDWRQGYAAVLQKFRDYLDAQAAQAKEPKKIDFQIYSDTQSGDVFIGKKGASGVIRLQTGFASAKEARNWLTDHYNDLALKWEGMRQEPVLRRASNEPRTGPKRREGDVTPEMFTEAFGFRGVQFGNYVEGDRRQRDLNNAFDAFMDLSEALGIPAKALSFDGSLGLAFGARGRGGKRPAAAHYEPGEVVINLTKNSGPGSLAHEWFHALDNYFARLERTGSTKPKDLDEWATRAMALPKNVRPEVMEAFRAIRNSLGGDLDRRSRALDSTRSAPYYSQTIEKAARAFETYVIDRLGKSSVSNDYLANIDPTSEAYPRPNEMDGGIRQAFDTLFTTLDTRQGERGTMLFAKPRTGLTAPNGQPSNLNAEDHALVRTPEFKKWAGDWEALEYQTRIEQFILDALDGKKDQEEIPLRKVTAQEVNEVMRQGGPNISGMEHVLDAAHIRHAFNSHSSKEEGDKNPGQRPLTKNDLMRIPEIINSYDSLRVKKAGTNRTSIIYGKSYQDGTINYIERVFETSKRNKPRLVTKTVWAVTEAGVKSNSTRVYTPDRGLKLPLENGRVNPESIKIQTDANGEPLASEIARFRQETAAESDQAPLAAKPRRTPPPLPPMEKRIEASLDAIENWNNVLRAAEEKPAGTSIRKLSTEIRDAVPLGLYMFYMNFLRGRLDRADALAPGVKRLIEKANQEEQMVQVGLAAVIDGLRNELKKSFGDPAFWSKNRARLKEATRMLLPVASYLQPERAGVDGGFVWREFERRSGTISQMEATDLKLKDGELFEYEGRVVRLGEYIPEWQSFVLLEPVSVEMQEAIYEQFFYTFPEALPILDRWITPDLADAFTVGEGSTLAVEFNREALLNYYNTWPKDLIESLEGVFPQVPRVEGYTPDIATQKAQVNVIARLLGKSKSPGRKFKSGALREAGKVQNLIDAFGTRAMQAHREKIRLRMREGIIEKAVVPRMSIPAENMGDYISLEDTFSDLVTAVETARYLDPKAYPNLSRALNPKDQMQLMKLVGDAARLRAGEMMIHKKVHDELMMSMAREQTEGMGYKILDWVLRAWKLSKLTVGSGQINWLSNQIQRSFQTYNSFLFGTFALMLGEKRGAKRGMYNFLYLLRGFMTDNMPNSFFNRERIGGLIPRQVFDDLTLLGSTDQDRAVGNIVEDIYRKGLLKGTADGLKQSLKQGGVPSGILYLINYSGGDVAVKQTTTYAAMQARAEVAADEAGIKKNRTEWKRKWIDKQIKEYTKEWEQALAIANLWYMNYKNVPTPLAPETTIIPANAPYGAMGPKALKLWKTHGFIFLKWTYNWFRFGKRMSLDSLLTSVDPASSKEERAQAFANMATLATIAFLGSWLLQPGDDEEPYEEIIGSRIDEDGKLRERHEDTSGRVNLSAFARNMGRSRIGNAFGWAVDKTGIGQLTSGLLKMSGLTVNEDFTNHRGDDYWMWYRNITWLPELFMAGKLVNGDLKGFLRDTGSYFSDMASLGVLSKAGGFVQASSQDANKEPINLVTEAVWEVATAPFLPDQVLKYGGALIDPTIRRRTDNETIGFDMTPLTTIQSKIPGLTKNLPPAGKPILPVLFSENYNEYRAYQDALENLNKRKNLTGEQRDKEREKIMEKFQRRNAQKTGIDLREVMFSMGLDPAKATARPTTRDVLSDLIELQAKGVGPSGVRVYQEQLNDGSVQPYMVYVDPETIPTRERALTLFKVFAGPNIRPFPKPPKKAPEQPALTPDFMFGGEQQANLTLPRQ